MTLTFEEFLAELKKAKIYFDEDYGAEYEGWRYSSNRKKVKDGEPAVSVKWSTGGISGGSCYDTGESHHYATSGETEPDFSGLDEIILHFQPEISYIKYKELTKDLIKVKNWSEGEYYGNSTDYAEKYVLLKELYNGLFGKSNDNADSGQCGVRKNVSRKKNRRTN